MRYPLLLSLLAACDGSDRPTPPKHGYVADSILLPSTVSPDPPYSLDLTGDGKVDNKFARMFSTFSYLGTFSFVTGTTKSIDRAELIDLFELATNDYSNASFATFETLIGSDPNPAACIDANDAVCRRHLDGNGQFTVQATDATPLVGTISNGTFLGGPGHAVLQLTSAGSSVHIVLPVIGAQVQVAMATDDSIASGILAGGVRVSDIDQILLSALREGFAALVARDCNDPTTTPGCGCIANSDGKAVIGYFDISPRDCAITLSDLQGHPDLAPLLTADLMLEGVPATSIGVGFTAVRAGFTP